MTLEADLTKYERMVNSIENIAKQEKLISTMIVMMEEIAQVLSTQKI